MYGPGSHGLHINYGPSLVNTCTSGHILDLVFSAYFREWSEGRGMYFYCFIRWWFDGVIFFGMAKLWSNGDQSDWFVSISESEDYVDNMISYSIKTVLYYQNLKIKCIVHPPVVDGALCQTVKQILFLHFLSTPNKQTLVSKESLQPPGLNLENGFCEYLKTFSLLFLLWDISWYLITLDPKFFRLTYV